MNISTTSISSPTRGSPQPGSPTLFSGTLAGSVEFERKQNRLPPVEEVKERMSYIVQRRIQSNADALHRDVDRMEHGEKFARKMAERRAADLTSWELVDHKRTSTARNARRTLLNSRDGRVAGNSRSHSHTALQSSKSEQQFAEAIRETARESARKEELRKRQETAKRAAELATRRAAELESQRQLEEQRREAAAQREQDWLARKMELEDARARGQLDNSSEREAEKQMVEQRRQAHSQMLKGMVEARAKERESREEARKVRIEALELAREQADEARRRERESMRLVTLSNRAAELARSSEQVWIQAQTMAARCEADVLRKQDMLRSLHDDAEPPRDALAALEKLEKRLEGARMREVSAKQQFDSATAAAAAAARKAKEAIARTPRK